MPFTVIKGTFQPTFGRPDGDSLRFVPDDPEPIFMLRRRGVPPKINRTNGSIQLRYEAIDTLEKRAIEPFSSDATESNLNLAGTEGGTTSATGYILANQIGPHGRPIAFVYAGETDHPDGSSVFLEADELANSINAEQLRLGHAYPLFYDTLFADLREFCTELATAARNAGNGVWSADATNEGFVWNDDLAMIPPAFPKLWRRIDSYARDDTFFDANAPLSNLKDYIESLGEERVFVLSEHRFTGFDDLVDTAGGKIRLLAKPEDMVIVSVQ